MTENREIFQEKRMDIFRELVQSFWNEGIQNNSDLENLAAHIQNKYEFKDKDMSLIRNHMRICMGLDPRGDTEFSSELSDIKSKKISPPIAANVENPHESDKHCNGRCKYEDPIYRRNNEPIIIDNKCLSCGYGVSQWDFGAIADKIEFIPLIDLLKDKNTPVYAAVAPAIVGQFGDDLSMGQLRTALKLMGFTDMVEVALFADILTIKEAFEFNKLVKSKEDFFLTSCCCPVWFNMVKKSYPDLYKKMSPSVSPMIASGRVLKSLYRNAKVVFISPCIAKKGEVKEPDLEGAIDFVINFRELKEVFEALKINLKDLVPDDIDQASLGGRLYARTGGVSFAVKTAVNRLEPTRVIKLRAKKVDGVKECKNILEDLRNGKDVDANFIEGMGCAGGCVGGPRTNIDVDVATKNVNEFGEESYILTPFDNKNIMKILENFGISDLEGIMENEMMVKLLTRE
ncbi:iron hydrogenase [Irregularibacter muris]|uniref:Iron hydrogenase n=1 Tax=Irregularibacter muris TaxID=1796619 RepID=A0AAE3HFB4_9FIRM|nr:[Fe-Fe] hydrogenase large subunit C-terminal domain-containing protein [Irregularibacter muris]MCR1897533.1 iron hydrogenase [Irregularibacter muris]